MASTNLTVFSFNARSLLHKLDELRVITTDVLKAPDVIAVCETWACPSESDAMYSLDGYNIFRSDRPTQGGGVLLYVK